MAKVGPGVWNRGWVKAGEVGAANARATLWPAFKINSFARHICIIMTLENCDRTSSHLKESPLLITFFPLVLKFLNLNQWWQFSKLSRRIEEYKSSDILWEKLPPVPIPLYSTLLYFTFKVILYFMEYRNLYRSSAAMDPPGKLLPLDL